MILFTIFDPATRRVISHKSISSPDGVAASIPFGMHALVGRHVPFGQDVPDGFEIVIPASPETRPIVLAITPAELVNG